MDLVLYCAASNRGFKEWGEVFGDNVIAAALLDRLLHHAVVIEIEGNSYRLRARGSVTVSIEGRPSADKKTSGKTTRQTPKSGRNSEK